MYSRTVLVVDDEPLIRISLADALKDEWYAVVEASSVLEAVAVLGTHDIDILITDVDMPGGLNGFDLVRFVRSSCRHESVVVTSGGSVPGEGVLEGEETFMAKPYRLDALIGSVDVHMTADHGRRVAV